MEIHFGCWSGRIVRIQMRPIEHVGKQVPTDHVTRISRTASVNDHATGLVISRALFDRAPVPGVDGCLAEGATLYGVKRQARLNATPIPL